MYSTVQKKWEWISMNLGTFRHFSAKMSELFWQIEFQRIFERMFEAALSYKFRYFELMYESSNKNYGYKGVSF